MECLAKDEDYSAILGIWSSVFNGVSIISNRETIFHHNGQSRVAWYDIICTLRGDENTVLEFHDLGIRLRYTSGTVVAHSGRLLYHGISVAENECVCYTYWMRDYT